LDIQQALKNILPFVQRPSRYIGKETGIALKTNFALNIALCYPDLYEIGMGNLALQILYERVNQTPNFLAQRVFAVWPDMEEKLKEAQIPLYTLENYTPLNQLDVLAFTLPFELVFTNVLAVLELGQVPLFSKDRTENHPFVLGGGPVCANPEPLAPFFDAFLIGEGEKAIIQALETIHEGKKQNLTRQEILKNIALISGFYVPSFYQIQYQNNGFYIENIQKTEDIAPQFIQKRVEKNLDNILPPSYFPISWTKPIHDKGMVEIFRGCYHRCRFCQAGNYYKPVRERSPKVIQEGIQKIFKNQGKREFSLLSLSSGDYSLLSELLSHLTQEWDQNFVSFYLPSIKINSFNIDVLSQISSVRKSGLTLAIEVGGEDTRKEINKEVSDEKLFEILRQAKEKGWKLAKLYFMIGITNNLEKEKEDIVALLQKLSLLFKGFQFHVSINLFIPKAQTPFQFRKIYPEEIAFLAMKDILAQVKKNRSLKISFSSSFGHFLEGFFARGSREAAHALLLAYQKGARFDGWQEQFNEPLWKDILESTKDVLNYNIFLSSLNKEKKLPWDFIKTGESQDFFKKEEERALNKEGSLGCQEFCADYCGHCNQEEKNLKAQPEFLTHKTPLLFKTAKDYQASVGVVFERPYPYNLVSQLEFLPYWEKVLTMAQMPLIFTEGFNPHPRMEFGFFAPVGIESFYENFRFQIWQDLSEEEIRQKIAPFYPANIVKIKVFKKRPPSLQSLTFFQDFSLKKVFVYDENLLSFIKEKGEILFEDQEAIDFRLPVTEKVKTLLSWCDFFKIQRLRCLTKEKEEVI